MRRAIYTGTGRKLATMDVRVGNAAFGETREDRDAELSRIADMVRRKLAEGETEGTCLDWNGNTVGTWRKAGAR